MSKQQQKKGVPWYVWAGIAAGGVAGGLYVISNVLQTTFGAGPAAAKAELTYWSNEYSKELLQIRSQNRLPTAAEEEALNRKKEQIDKAYDELFSVWGIARDVLIGIVVVGGLAWLIRGLARDYLNRNKGNMQTAASSMEYIRAAHALDEFAEGNVSLAVAFQDQTNAVFSSSYSPLLQTEIVTLQSQLPTLVGNQLLLTQLLVQNLQLEVAETIPSLLAEVTSLLATLPPP